MAPPFRHRERVRYADCDPQGVLFNANHLTYFDVALTELWREELGSYESMTREGTDMVVAAASVRYLAPVPFDAEVDLVIDWIRLGETSMTTCIAIENGGVRCSEGEMRHVFIDTDGGGKTQVPGAVRSALGPYEPVEGKR
ncbi:MAG TPA: thioesterase family protein [Thermoleophilaceae bacterium]|nr:thioesterase family protein [Thermoleophilaceae bacterium]